MENNENGGSDDQEEKPMEIKVIKELGREVKSLFPFDDVITRVSTIKKLTEQRKKKDDSE